MQGIDILIDEEPSFAKEMVENDIRNRQAHVELQSYNDSGVFRYIHPIAIQHRYARETASELRDLLKNNLDKFLQEIANTSQNIKRIKSDIRKKKYKDEQQLRSWIENLNRAEIKLNLLKECIPK